MGRSFCQLSPCIGNLASISSLPLNTIIIINALQQYDDMLCRPSRES